jgi:hypothetical protein
VTKLHACCILTTGACGDYCWCKHAQPPLVCFWVTMEPSPTRMQKTVIVYASSSSHAPDLLMRSVCHMSMIRILCSRVAE